MTRLRPRLWIVLAYLLLLALLAGALWWWIPRDVLQALRSTYLAPGAGEP